MDHKAVEETTEPIDGVQLAQVASGELMSVQHFEIEPGAEVPLHSHRHEQSGFVAEGTLTFILEDGVEVDVAAGESFNFRGNEKHAAENRGDTTVVGVDVFCPPRLNPPWEKE